jgi:hypothetical protein
MHGSVYATTFVGGMPIAIDPLPATKIEFYEVDTPIFWLIGSTPTLTEAFLGYAYSGPDGSYNFEFDFTVSPWIIYWWWFDRKPDIRARISQSIGGIWQKVYEGAVDWDIVEDFHRDYFIPIEDTIPVPDTGVKPSEGFRFMSLGLLPIDAAHISGGYATAKPGDPARIIGISHQPFCGVLRIFGLFAETPLVANYEVQIARVSNASVDLTDPALSWERVADPLYNHQWNNASHRWDSIVLGPDPVTRRYKNIDPEPEADWHEHALKVTWNSANEPNGYYGLRIVAYDAANVQIGMFTMPILRIDNSRPDAVLEAIGTTVGNVTNCGALRLGADRMLSFKITAYDPEGHMLGYWLSGTRGKDALSAGATLSVGRPDIAANWTGALSETQNFLVTALPGSLMTCPMLAYNFELHVHGLSTDGYEVTPASQRVKREVNLIVSEP